MTAAKKPATQSKTASAQMLAARIARLYGLAPGRVLPPQTGYRNRSFPVQLRGGNTVNIVIYKNEPGIVARIRAAHMVASALANHGFPVRRPLSPRIVRLRAGPTNRFAGLYNYLDGQTIPWEAYSRTHIKLLGKTMSDMHAALAQSANDGLPDIAGEYRAIAERMKQYIDASGVRQAMAAKLGLAIAPGSVAGFAPLLAACARLPGQQPLHMDFVRGNILFAPAQAGDAFGTRVSGILDFEKAGRGHPLLDIGRTLAFLLVDCKNYDENAVRKYFLRSGYHKRGQTPLRSITVKQQGETHDLLEALVSFFLLHDLYKFLRHNPYESLPRNAHFRRTLELLRRQGLVVPA